MGSIYSRLYKDGTVSYFVRSRSNGISTTNRFQTRQEAEQFCKEQPEMSLCRRFTLEDRRQIQQMLNENKTVSQIAAVQHRNRSSIYKEIKSHGGMLNYDADKAHEDTLMGTRKVAAHQTRYIPQELASEINDKIVAMQMQLDILADQIIILTRNQKEIHGE